MVGAVIRSLTYRNGVPKLNEPGFAVAVSAQGIMMVRNMPGKGSRSTGLRTRFALLLCSAFVALVLVLPGGGAAQIDLKIDHTRLQGVMPEATGFSEKMGIPPVYHAFADDPNGAQVLVGYLFLTSDLPPEEFGYSGTIKVLVGVDLIGNLTGAAVINYHEAQVSSKGDFLRAPGVESQYAGKHVADPFRIYRDIDGVSGSTISAGAMSRGIRNSARRVAMAYLRRPAPTAMAASNGGGLTAEAFERLSWLELVSSGLIAKMEVIRYNALGLDLSFTYAGSSRLGAILVGADSYASMLEKVGPRHEDFHLMILGLDGSFIAGFRPRGLTVLQGGNSYPLPRNQVVYWGRPEEGKMAEQVFYAAMLLVDPTVDVSQPFTIQYDDDQGDPFAIEYTITPDVLEFARGGSAAVQATAASDEGGTSSGGTLATAGSEAASVPNGTPGAHGTSGTNGANVTNGTTREATPPVEPAGALTPPAGGVSAAQPAPATADVGAPADQAGLGLDFDFEAEEEESAFSVMLAQTRWSRVVGLLIILGLALNAFTFKGVAARRVALGGTLVYLGWVDGGFLSISHITSGIAGGPGVYLGDLAMLVMIIFTVVTTVLWGRVFCGFLCPFGALQDFIEWVVPKRFQRKVPTQVHDRAIYTKYGILALILVTALINSDLSIYGYFEPFGTVFFMSSSVLMWTIAGSVLLASAVIPRFYCRYACPLGAALGVASFVSFFRIPRVKQCDVCKVCEQSCPTGAISGPDVDFKECVRCNVCEVKLLTKAGVCKHDMEEIQPRLVQLQTPVGSD